MYGAEIYSLKNRNANFCHKKYKLNVIYLAKIIHTFGLYQFKGKHLAATNRRFSSLLIVPDECYFRYAFTICSGTIYINIYSPHIKIEQIITHQ